jgi:hypothetical protein
MEVANKDGLKNSDLVSKVKISLFQAMEAHRIARG